MPSLDSLPAETLLIIARILGGAYLRGRVDHILLFRSWYSVTQSVAWEDVALSLSTLTGFLQAPPDVQSFIRSRVKHLSISGSYSIPNELHHLASRQSVSDPAHTEAQKRARWRTQQHARSTELSSALAAFSTGLAQMRKLRTFRLALSCDAETYASVAADDTWTAALKSVVAALPPSLESLTMDKLGPTTRYATAGESDAHAVCQALHARNALPALRHLRLRVHCVCPELFDVVRIGVHPVLETVVVSLTAGDPDVDIVHHARCCTDPQRQSQWLYADMVDAARCAVSACFPSIRTLRIVRYDVQALKFSSDDIVSGEIVDLPEGVSWDDVDGGDERVAAADEAIGSGDHVYLGDDVVEEEVGHVAATVQAMVGVELMPEMTLTININTAV
ncbi:uncharacterized protein L3040_007283 [Drepanopeziza brunnea f. sp. 'multigermtubi']|uniref:F-box domain-containing protein n=1 Tax=Marssonina brunnea f. sp. multigermtubi (strain MB_m1) TaxID=1072389 RepID=K1X5A2_MARBU|nr:uncharacterized protein MBM_00954 [Drepanopeziza brunnea f. sp. 'multigermtubi' MB_m1]EKD20272.1 hypothetical protein MBM_00954 [Drepanopeziza brunnea f. sp. 'multigermtubi' MB_m1]KAJ5038421.1 hypothetical protein L3040_007283 [Drepanopeziza brunnea f. sp. 'multigermtubi']